MSQTNPEMLDSLYAWLCECAAAGAACPANQAICDRYGFKSISSAAVALQKLEKDGRVSVVRFNKARQVNIIATGQSTLNPKAEAVTRNAQRPPPLRRKRAVAPKEVKAKSPPQKPRKSPPGSVGPRERQCQWIEGEPTETDACKCLATTTSDSPYCFHHKQRATSGLYVPLRLRMQTGAANG